MSTEKRILIGSGIQPSSTNWSNQRTTSWSLTAEEQQQYNMTNMQVEFTFSSSNYNAMVLSQAYTDEQIVSDCGSYKTRCVAGEPTRYNLSSWAWENRTSGTIITKFAKSTTNNVTFTYTNVYIVITLEEKETIAPSTISITTVNVGETQNATINNVSPNATHVVQWSYAGKTSQGVATTITSSETTLSASERSTSFAIPANKIEEIYYNTTTSATASGTLYVTTQQNGTAVSGGDHAAWSAYLTIPNTSDGSMPTKPTVDTVSISVNHKDTSIDYLQNHSRINVAASFSPKYGASISKIRITTPDYAAEASAQNNAYTFVVPLQTSGTYTIKLIAIDSRGFLSDEYSTSITVVECSPPVFTQLTAARCTDLGVIDDEAEYVKITVQASASIGGSPATITYSVDTYESGNSGGSHYQPTLSGSSPYVIGDSNNLFDKEKSYEIVVTATATATISGTQVTQTATAFTFVGSATYTIYRMAGGKGIAFGKIAEHKGVEVAETWPLYTHGKEIMELIIDMAHPVNSTLSTLDVYFDPRVEWPWTYWNKLSEIASTNPSYTTYTWVRIQ